MTTLADLAQEVENIIQDDAVTFDVNDKINAGLKDVSARVLIQDLDTIAEIETSDSDANYVSLPDDFQRELGKWAYNVETNQRIKVYASASQLFSQVSKLDLAGNVFGIASQGGNLVYQRVPASAHTLKIQYFKFPTELEDATDEPDCLPAHLHSDLLVNYVCWKYWEKIEDGDDGKKPNTAMRKSLYVEALGSLQAFIGPFSGIPREPVDVWNFESLVNC